jgi:signal transduction histidine kinase
MHEAVMVLDADGTVVAENESACRVIADLSATDAATPDRASDAIGLDGTVIPLDERPVPYTLATGEAVSGRVIGFPLESGETRWLEIDTQPLVRPGEDLPYAVVLSMDDITDRLALDQLKTQFVSIVSHELRTPLTAIQGSLKLLASGALGELPPKSSRMIDMAQSNSERLVRLVNDILDLQRMESGAEELQLSAFTDEILLDEVAALMQPLASEAGVTLTIDPARVSMTADHDRLIQTLSNLVGNAVKFSETGGRVSLASSEDDGVLRFTVADEGRGIPSDKLDSIFGRFQQVEASDARAKGGTGLGLAISKQIVELHGGSIHVESELGSGSTFIFTIPTDSPAPGNSPTSSVTEIEERPDAADRALQDVGAR